MKKLVLFVLLIIASLYTNEVYAQEEGKWGYETERSLTPDRPSGNITNGIFTIDFTSFIVDLTIQVTNKEKVVVYQEVVTIMAPSQYVIDLNFLPAGEYTYNFIHRCGHLWADFTIE